MTQRKDWPSTESTQRARSPDVARKILTYAVRQAGTAWHWEVRENGKLIDCGVANSVVSARVAAFSVGRNRPRSTESP